MGMKGPWLGVQKLWVWKFDVCWKRGFTFWCLRLALLVYVDMLSYLLHQGLILLRGSRGNVRICSGMSFWSLQSGVLKVFVVLPGCFVNC